MTDTWPEVKERLRRYTDDIPADSYIQNAFDNDIRAALAKIDEQAAEIEALKADGDTLRKIANNRAGEMDDAWTKRQVLIYTALTEAEYPDFIRREHARLFPVADEVVEKMAKALCDHEWDGSQPWGRKPKSFEDRYRSEARAALAVLREE